MAKICVIQDGATRELTAQAGERLYDVLKENGVRLDAPCGGRCFCGKCRVRIADAPEPTKAERNLLAQEELAQGVRLACAVRIQGDMRVETLAERAGEAKIQVEGYSAAFDVEPRVRRVRAAMEAPTLADQEGDLERLSRALGSGVQLPLEVAAQAADAFRSNGWQATLTLLGDRVLALGEGPLLGVAVDIGTTTMVAYLLDLKDGREMAVRSCLNPQGVHGADVIVRSDYATAGGLQEMADLVRAQIDGMIGELCEETGVARRDIYQVVTVGNTIMMHLFATLPPKHIAVSPFIPVYTRGFDVPAAQLGLSIHPRGMVTLMPCVAGYVGADTIAAVLASGMDQQEELSLMVDIGTNGEIALGNREGMATCSAAAGPAFEGAHIQYGMGGVAGAISKVTVEAERVVCQTIGGEPARGICGSGLVDAISGMKDLGVIDEMGRILEDEEIESPWLRQRVRELEGKPAFLLISEQEGAARDVYVCQRDLREVQLAKGAIAAGIEVLLRERGVKFDQISALYLAGGFGNYIDCGHACNIGLLPPELRERIRPIGNGAGSGARMALLSAAAWERAERLREGARYIELSSRADFQELFVDKMML